MNSAKLREHLYAKIEENRQETIDMLLKILSFRSINFQHTGEEKAAQEWFNTKLTELGFKTEMFDVDPEFLADYDYFIPPQGRNYKDRPNVAGVLKGKGGGRSLVLNGHMDVVPLGDEANWKHNPWGELKDGKVFGRGSSDMKGGLVGMYMAVKALKDLGIELQGDLIFQSVVDEESSGNGTLMCIAKGYTGDAGIVGECTDLQIQTAHRGVQFLRVTTTGISGHAAQRQKLVSAIDKMVYLYNKLMECEQKERWPKQHELLSSPTISVGMFHGGDAPHIVADKCEINCDVKYLPYESGEEVRKIINGYLEDAAKADPWLRENPPKIEWVLDADPSEIPNDHPVVKAVGEAFKAVTGQEAKISGMQGCADMRHLIKRGNTPSLLFGPGNINTAHQANEYIDIDQLMTAIKVYAEFILNWCGA
ncbi:MAG: ArgE/DapE family deacylase [Firmicutes bacterium]|nr:ArgE/DapE family deacylase [Bacillota bacterium]